MKSRTHRNKPEGPGADPGRELPLRPEDISELEHGVRLFNSGKFRQAHEAWELVWQRTPHEGRNFLQGLTHLAAAYHTMAKDRDAAGFVENLLKAGESLRVFGPRYLGVEISSLLEAVEAGIAAAGRNGGTDPPALDPAIVPEIVFHVHYHPDLSASIRAVLDGGVFAEGVDLFNAGYHWEAHEKWEEAARDCDGDGKSFLEGFIQAAGGISFLRSGKVETAGYLLSKAAGNLKRYDDLGAAVDVSGILGWISSHVGTDPAGRPTVKIPPDPVPPLRLFPE